ncbi:hypothetical protein [Streptomyces bambusae]|uniref:Secreted protein n=1 Tax=Streptomyces bambusae TaxID=1550616 RepID=A0ABS6Z3M3_9ACTN|nr:hypothetical protein [Streptomyces bambusae]MBW5482176.1 hypothetical protein [Streptomyces bambusae]
MSRLALLAAGVAGLTVLAIAPAGAAAPSPNTTGTVTSCGASGLQAGLATKVCAEITGTTVEIYGKVSLAGPPSPGSPMPAPKQLFTTLSAEVVGVASPETRTKEVLFTSTTLEVRGLTTNVPCGSTVRGTFGVSSYPWAAKPVVHEVTITC